MIRGKNEQKKKGTMGLGGRNPATMKVDVRFRVAGHGDHGRRASRAFCPDRGGSRGRRSRSGVPRCEGRREVRFGNLAAEDYRKHPYGPAPADFEKVAETGVQIRR